MSSGACVCSQMSLAVRSDTFYNAYNTSLQIQYSETHSWSSNRSLTLVGLDIKLLYSLAWGPVDLNIH